MSDAALVSLSGDPPGSADDRLRRFLERRFGREGAVEVAALSGDASSRRYYRLRDGGTTRVVSVYPEPFDAERLPFTVMQSLMAGWGIRVPAVIDVDGALGVLVVEDLGDVTLQEALPSASPEERRRLYREAVDQMIVLQREAARSAEQAPCFQVAFDVEKLSWELHYFLKHFLEGHRGCDLTAEDSSILSTGFHRLAEEIASWPRVLCHRDYHSRNLMLFRGALYAIDFQDARMGPATYDLVSLLRDSYVDLEEGFLEELAEEFREKAVPAEAREVFRRRFDLMSVQRNLKALGTFGYQASVRGNRVYLPYIPRTLASSRKNLSRYPELAGLWRVLANHVRELR
jgi:N-acetylmuramate 1-kinase